ncbi:glutathione peroxidase, partial [Phocaeicola vulgatus]
PLYQWLTHKSENGVSDAKIGWNFHKFLIDENGRWVASIGSTTSPLSQEIVGWIEE